MIYFGMKGLHNLLWNRETTKFTLKWRSYRFYFGVEKLQNLLWNGEAT